jgi:E-phenylitaconyl-CoA hydratase
MAHEIPRRAFLVGAAIAGSAVAIKSAATASPPPAFQTLKFETSGPICIISLNRPDDDNIVNAVAVRELPLAWEAFRSDDSLRVAIFTGAGDQVFCGGVESEVSRGGTPPAYPRRDEGSRPYTSKQNKCWKPVIAAVNGIVAGPGLHFVLDADISICVPEARFFDLHMHRTGSVPIIEPIEMSRKIPYEAVARMFLLGPHDPIDAQRAHELGLVSEVVKRDRLMPRAMEMAQQIAQADMHLTTAFVEALYKSRELGATEAINRGLIIRQLTGYRDAPLKGRSIRDLAKPGSKL